MKCVDFKKPAIKWFKSYLSNRKFLYQLKELSRRKVLFPQGSILVPLLFLIYVNDLPQSLSETASNLFTEDRCIYYQHWDIQKIENVLNKKVSSVCEWFINKKLSIHIGEVKTKVNLFTSNKTECLFSRSFHETI